MHIASSFLLRASASLALLAATLIGSTAHGHAAGGFPPDLQSHPRLPLRTPAPGTFVNFETPQVHPIDLSPNGATLVACNTADNRLEVFSVNGTTGALTATDSIPVGYDPVSVRFRTNFEVWVVNQISDSISIVDLATGHVVITLQTGDEPADVVFYRDAGDNTPLAAVSCSRPDKIQVFDINAPSAITMIGELPLLGQDPRSLATDGTTVYAAIFESGNSTTIIGNNTIFNALEDPSGPYGGQNPPFNNGVPGSAWVTPGGAVNLASVPAGPPPQVSLIVRKDDAGVWRDDNGADWSSFINGANAGLSGRPGGWDLLDNDIAGFSTTNGVTALNPGFGTNGYVTRRMTICMALGINPSNNNVMLVGTEATNEIRFEPNITGTFTRVRAAIADGTTGAEVALTDMNAEHLDIANGGSGNGALAYISANLPQSERNKSIGDPRGVAFNPAGTRAYVTGMGSGNVVVIDPATGQRMGGVGHTINTGGGTPGPTGAVHHPTLNRLYVLNKFAADVVAIDTTTLGSESVVQSLGFFDPTPSYINLGRDDFYDTHQNSGLGQIACASCHIDGRNDQLAWDLGNPLGAMKNVNPVDLVTPQPDQHNMFLNGFIEPYDNYHPMKGPMTTQTLQDIIGHEPHHWRGDRDGIEEFAAAFASLQGDDIPLLAGPMQEFEDFLSSLTFSPNPFRALDNSLPGGPKFVGGGTNPLLPLPGFHSNGPNSKNPTLSPQGTPLPDGNAWRGFSLFVQGNPLHATGPHSPESLDNIFQCATCHALPTGSGTIDAQQLGFSPLGFNFVPIPFGPNGEAHLAVFSNDGTGNTDGTTGSVNQGTFKIPQLRNQLDKQGFITKPDPNNGGLPYPATAGFGVLHDGAVDNLDTFIGSTAFDMDDDQDLADVLSFALCINGDDFDRLAALPGAPTFFSPTVDEDGNPPGLPIASGVGQLGPRGAATKTAHAAVGQQITLGQLPLSTPEQERLAFFHLLASSGAVDLIAKGEMAGVRRGWVFNKNTSMYTTDINGEPEMQPIAVIALAAPGSEITFTIVPAGSGTRMGIDRNEDGTFDRTEFLTRDSDSDGLPDVDETNTGVFVNSTDTGTDPNVADTDGDGLNDGVEVGQGTDPNKSDTDGDGLSDAVETGTGVFVDATDTGSDPVVADTDGDGVADGAEVTAGTDPNQVPRSTGGGGSGGLCFIATAAYGTPLSEHIGALRGFRDAHLLPNPLGALFTDTYYRLSPPAAGYIAARPALRAAARVVIAPITWLVEENLAAAAGFGLISLLAFSAIVRKRATTAK